MPASKNFLAILIFFLLPLFSFSQNSYWMQKAGSVTADEGQDITIDANGNTYTTGYFSGTAAFGNITLNSSGLTDIFIAKNNNIGGYEWAVKAGGPGSDRGLSIKADDQGNTYITGFFYGTASFKNQTIVSEGLQDIFIAKYNNAGALQWVKSAGGSNADIGYGINIDNAGNVAVTGEFVGTADFGSTSIVSMNNTIDIFTTKLSSTGNFLWTKKGSAPFIDRGLDIACDAFGNIYVTGQFTDTITFDVTHNNNMYNAIFLIKYDSSGQEKWFRKIGGATFNIANGIAVDQNNDILLTGDFKGNLIFFGSPNITLTNQYVNRIFLAKYSSEGNLLWMRADGSESEVTSKNICVDTLGNSYIIGNFKCKLSQYADEYGQGTFNSVGFWDIFVSKYNAFGTWAWSRQTGGREDDYGAGITVNKQEQVFITGSFYDKIHTTASNLFIGYNTTPMYPGGAYCNDVYYGYYQRLESTGNSDILIAKNIDTTRQPYDYYLRSSIGCDKSFLGVCINKPYSLGCTDSVVFCKEGYLNTYSNTNSVGPGFNYVWSQGDTIGYIYTSSSGWFSVIQTSEDGCFISADSIYVTVNPLPAKPTISDSENINNNALNTTPVGLCGDSVLLTGSNLGTGNLYGWNNVLNNQEAYWAKSSGRYYFYVQNIYGCRDSNFVDLILDSLFVTFEPEMVCLEDTDKNDSISICAGSFFQMFIYDTLTNPSAQLNCINSIIMWSSTLNTITYKPVTNCSDYIYSLNKFFPQQTGFYQINATLIRSNYCEGDTVNINKTIYVNVLPEPDVLISGDTMLCPNDSVLLIGSGAADYYWGDKNSAAPEYNNDSIWMDKPGNYYVWGLNSLGCIDTTPVNIYIKPQPNVSMDPIIGLICPNDSVQLTCNGIGPFQWQGPAGPVAGDTSSIKVNVPGFYYCIRTDSDNCTLISNSVLVNQYATPFLLPSPTNFLCNEDTLTISVITNEGSTIQWQSPLSGSNNTQLVSSPGIYTCSINSCGITTTAQIEIFQSLVTANITANGPLTFCSGDSVTLYANPGMPHYLWEPGAFSDSVLTVYTSGIYILTASDDNGCAVSSDPIEVIVGSGIVSTPLVSDTIICYGDDALITATGSGSIQWFDNFTDNNLVYTGHSLFLPGLSSSRTYYLVSTDSGCYSSRVPVQIGIENCDSIFIPNVFTPNGEGPNDVFLFTIKRFKCFYAEIYNRWGMIIYKWDNGYEGWDGTIMQSGKKASDGVYYYLMNYCDYISGEIKSYKGFVHLLGNRE